MGRQIRIALAGDVMIGRGIDQIMRHPVDPRLHERWALSALRYVELAESRSGPLPRGVDLSYVWGDCLGRLQRLGAHLRIVNLETAVTARGEPWPGKGIHYRVHPRNAKCLVAGGIDAVTVANNHVLDWSLPGLMDTLDTLDAMGIGRAGAGREPGEAWAPVVIGTGGSGSVAVLGVATRSSGVGAAWSAREGRPGVALLAALDHQSVQAIGHALEEHTAPDQVTIVSIHWGSNWGYRVPAAHREFARALIDDAGVDVVHGHSSHHPLGFELHSDRLIIYGCGDLLTDYEGIAGHEEYRPDLGAWYVADVDSRSGALQELRLVPTRIRQFRLTTPSPGEMDWLSTRLVERRLAPGVGISVADDHLVVEW